MFIKQVILDGFKSYGKKVAVGQFDQEFTAITGLNGTGKSNILDAICFVLGISNLSQVRAGSLNELVYKSGQAGITKATVTVIFDNSNPNQCPLGYEKCHEISVTRQIVVGGKNKYLINGKNVQNKKVSDLFCSIQLNVNNPSFLIMQGRITKVLNMKPWEILSMIEEAAGTRLYETKKEATTKLIEKKEAKVKEIDSLMNEEVAPKLERLRKEKAAYNKYQKLERDIDFLTRVSVSHKYLKQKDAVEQNEKKLNELETRIKENENKIEVNNCEMVNLEKASEDIQKKIDEESGGELKLLEGKLSLLSSEEAKSSGSLKAIQSQIEQEQKKLKNLTKNIKEDEEALKVKENEMKMVGNLFEKLKLADENDSKAYEKAQKNYEAIQKGLSTDENGEASTLKEQLISAKQSFSESKTIIKTSEMELKHFRSTLRQKESETQTSDTSYRKDKAFSEKLEIEIKKLSEDLESIAYQEGSLQSLQSQELHHTQAIRSLQRDLDRKIAWSYELQYTDPEPNFDRRKVKGMVCKLFTVKDPKHLLALSSAAGGRLMNIVTDDDITSKKIIQRGNVKQRVVVIPMNKITSGEVDGRKVKRAQQLVGRENVEAALNLIDYDPFYYAVMKYVFGGVLICKDLNIAKEVTYHKDILVGTVTLLGDSVDPGGTLSGGSVSKGPPLLKEVAEIQAIESEIKVKNVELKQIQEQLRSVEILETSYSKIKQKLELRQHELSACQSRLSQTSFQQHQEEILELKNKIETLEKDHANAVNQQRRSLLKVKDVEVKLKDAKGFREREVKAATEAMKVAKKKMEESRANWNKREQDYETLRMEIEELNKCCEASNIQLEKMNTNLKQIKENSEQLSSGTSSLKKQVSEVKSLIKEQKDKINSQNRELKKIQQRQDKLKKDCENFKLEIVKTQNCVDKVKQINKAQFDKIVNLQAAYPWILEDQQLFGKKMTRYDYEKTDPNEAGLQLVKLIAEKDQLERGLNISAMMLLEREEEQFKVTSKKRDTLDEDKKKIQSFIKNMDEKKKEKIDKAWRSVDNNFSQIFTALLPGSQASLKPTVENHNLTGLEIKVGFNGKWKESLGELSGGQRSLVALSLILAMLKFSPAPLYILDEVDAALDMSHTQNIGSMLKTHFKDSQFIIVSLKDGMFNNANVLFKTKFENGFSAVTRTESNIRNRQH
ncbi:SMC2.2 family protein [Megaselia abdita]